MRPDFELQLTKSAGETTAQIETDDKSGGTLGSQNSGGHQNFPKSVDMTRALQLLMQTNRQHILVIKRHVNTGDTEDPDQNMSTQITVMPDQQLSART